MCVDLGTAAFMVSQVQTTSSTNTQSGPSTGGVKVTSVAVENSPIARVPPLRGLYHAARTSGPVAQSSRTPAGCSGAGRPWRTNLHCRAQRGTRPAHPVEQQDALVRNAGGRGVTPSVGAGESSARRLAGRWHPSKDGLHGCVARSAAAKLPHRVVAVGHTAAAAKTDRAIGGAHPRAVAALGST